MLQIYYEFSFEKKNNISIWIFNLFYTLHFVSRLGCREPQIWQPCHRYGCCDTGGGSRDTGLASVPQIWPLWNRFSRRDTGLASVPQIWQPCFRSGFRAIDLAILTQIWQPCHRFGFSATDLAAVQEGWQLCHNLATASKFKGFSKPLSDQVCQVFQDYKTWMSFCEQCVVYVR